MPGDDVGQLMVTAIELRRQMGELEDELENARQEIATLRAERDALREQLREANPEASLQGFSADELSQALARITEAKESSDEQG